MSPSSSGSMPIQSAPSGADRLDGLLLRSPRHCADCRGFGKAVTRSRPYAAPKSGSGIGARSAADESRQGGVSMGDSVVDLMAHKAKATAVVLLENGEPFDL